MKMKNLHCRYTVGKGVSINFQTGLIIL